MAEGREIPKGWHDPMENLRPQIIHLDQCDPFGILRPPPWHRRACSGRQHGTATWVWRRGPRRPAGKRGGEHSEWLVVWPCECVGAMSFIEVGGGRKITAGCLQFVCCRHL